MTKRIPGSRIVSFIGQKGGVGKSALARVLTVKAARSGRRVLLADFDLEQLSCVEWNAMRMRRGVEPELDVRPFKSLKRLRRTEESFDLVVADTRGLADGLTKEVAEESDVVFLPTGCSADDLRPTLVLARKLARRGAQRITLVLSKVGRSERRIALVSNHLRDEGFDLLESRWLLREAVQAEFDAGRTGLESRNASLRAMTDSLACALMRRALPSAGEEFAPPLQMDGVAAR